MFMPTQVSSIHDAAQEELKEIAVTGTLKAGEKALAELKKRKLVVQKYVVLLVSLCRMSLISLTPYKKRPMV